MVMRYYWGLAVGHAYTHATDDTNLPSTQASSASENNMDRADDQELDKNSGDTAQPSERDNDAPDNDPEFGFENRQDDFIDDAEVPDNGGIEDDEEFLAMNDMYWFDYD